MTTTISKFEPPRLFEEKWNHRCQVTQRDLSGSRRHQLFDHGRGTLLACTKTQTMFGLRGLLFRMFPGLYDGGGLFPFLQAVRQAAENRYKRAEGEPEIP